MNKYEILKMKVMYHSKKLLDISRKNVKIMEHLVKTKLIFKLFFSIACKG